MEKTMNLELIEPDGTVRKMTDELGGEKLPTETATTDIAIRSEMGQLMKMAIEKNMVDSLEKLISLKRAEEERQCKREFDRDFAEMQKEFDPVKRTKENKKYNSKYAPVDALQRQYGPILSAHGFAYDWEEEPHEDGSVTSWFLLSKYGHTKRTPVKMPAYTPDKAAASGKDIMNPLQAVGTVLSYGHRYSMKSGLGITEEDEDTDGIFLTFDDGLEYAPYWEVFTTCKTPASVKEEWKKFMDENINNKDARTIICKLAERRQEQLKKENANE